MKLTKNTLIRAAKTFFQAVVAYALVTLKGGVDFTSKNALHAFLTGLIAAGLAALMNLEYPDETGGAELLSFEEFVKRYLGRSTDYDGACGVQCVDLAKLYIDRVLGVKPLAIGNAHRYYDGFESSYLKKHFVKIPYEKGVLSQKGDLVVWGKNYNGSSQHGHIAIATGVQDGVSITTYDQNWCGSEMKRVKHSLAGLSGFLRPIENVTAEPQKPPRYFKKCAQNHASIVDALGSVGAKSTFTYRKKIAAANGIKHYLGTAEQNVKMLSLLKKGRLIKP